jgi:exodeoxyribonuclease-3
MRIATWNINGLKARIDYLVHWLREISPDVVGLQELKMPDAQFPHDAFRELGYQAVCHGQKSWNGVAVLTREPARVLQSGLPGQEDLGARLLSVEVHGLDFTTVYCPNGKSLDHPDFARKLAWYDALIAHLGEARDKDRPVVLCGDFNIVPAAIDTWNEDAFRGGIFHTDDERARLRTLIDAGFIDLYRRQHPEEPGFSWWDYRGGAFPRRQGLRIDLVLGTAGVAERMRDATVDRRWRKKQAGLIASDHAPVWIDLD